MQEITTLSGNRAARRAKREPMTTTIHGVCEMTSLGRTKVYQLIREGRLKATAVGRRRLVFTDSIRALLNGEAI